MRDRKMPGRASPNVLVSVPVFNKCVSPYLSLDETSWERIMIMLKDPSNTHDINTLIADIQNSLTPA